MRKLMVALGVVMLGISAARAEFFWSWWDREDIRDAKVKGCVLGLSSKVDAIKAGVQGDLIISRAKEIRNGAQIGFFNQADSASLQFGLLCFNKTGFLPFCVFFNMDKSMFGSK